MNRIIDIINLHNKEMNLTESLKLNSNTQIYDKRKDYKFFPKDKEELKQILKDLIHQRGPNANLNDIDTSKITDMSYLFYRRSEQIEKIDISNWDVSNVEDMSMMFKDCNQFSCNLSKWKPLKLKTTFEMFKNCFNFNDKIFSNTIKLENARGMFKNCKTFNQDISDLFTENLKITESMFMGCENFNEDISNWKLPKLNNMNWMFSCCTNFNKDLSKWKINKNVKKIGVFLKCINLKTIPIWYKQPINYGISNQ